MKTEPVNQSQKHDRIRDKADSSHQTKAKKAIADPVTVVMTTMCPVRRRI